MQVRTIREIATTLIGGERVIIPKGSVLELDDQTASSYVVWYGKNLVVLFHSEARLVGIGDERKEDDT